MKILKTIIGIIIITFTNFAFAQDAPSVNCVGLPGCDSGTDKVTGNVGLDFIVKATSEFIKFIAVIAVFALIFSGIMYLISMGEEEKVNKAKNWIIYSLIGVFVSISAWGIINLLNGITIG